VQNHFIGTKSLFRQIFCLQLAIGGFVADGDNTIMLQQSNQMVAKINPVISCVLSVASGKPSGHDCHFSLKTLASFNYLLYLCRQAKYKK
jgi:hypothetical protein